MVKISRTLHKRVKGRGRGKVRRNPRKRKKRLKFKEEVEIIAKNIEGRDVPKKWQHRYGKRYSRDEALTVARRIKGKRIKMER